VSSSSSEEEQSVGEIGEEKCDKTIIRKINHEIIYEKGLSIIELPEYI
jgi:hypothetical protein